MFSISDVTPVHTNKVANKKQNYGIAVSLLFLMIIVIAVFVNLITFVI